MTRTQTSTDFPVDVEGIGTFFFGQRSLRDEMRIAAEYSRLTEGVETPTEWLQYVATWVSTLKVLTVTAPDGWDIDAMDPMDEDTYANLRRVHIALREKEQSFRQGKTGKGKEERKGDSAGSGVLVPAEVRPSAD